ncbi:MAG: hypothetical protein ACUVX9_16720 [Anaerolineae bacterium]
MLDPDLLAEAETDASLRAIARCLREAAEQVEAAAASNATPGRKVDLTAGVLEWLGDRLDSLADWVPARHP